MIDNIIFQKVWQDGNLIELEITANSEFVSAYQKCYVENEFLRKIIVIIKKFIEKNDEECYIEFGNKEGNFTPAFSMKILPADAYGHVKIELDIEIDDNSKRAHKCCFYVSSEIGRLEEMGKKLSKFGESELGSICSLNYLD